MVYYLAGVGNVDRGHLYPRICANRREFCKARNLPLKTSCNGLCYNVHQVINGRLT